MAWPQRFDPFDRHPITHFRDELNRTFQRFFGQPFLTSGGFLAECGTFMPTFNVEEHEDHYMVEAELPGMDIKDVNIEVSGNTLVIKGEKRRKIEREKEGHVHVMESSYGSFHRSFTLPENADPQGITAKSRNGVLYIRIPKDQTKTPRRIEIRDDNPLQ
ncbi:heat-shock protein [Polycladomyces abyssicola]|uniref:Heat-shock protein n=1 Tax=Polycladomyces abyssicola TaxID=1125966 RepID=A0A8D5UFD4_9BACL|nr:Hsp20/alpha crystallin family protein [Polycladomyces abyssicola]BCU80992.1 heat-shock protein [Polycladomyces abyssicola]